MYNEGSKQLSSIPAGLVGGTQVSNVPRKETQMEAELGALKDSTQTLESLLTTLYNRLNPFMRQTLDEEGLGKPVEELPPAISIIRENRFSVQVSSERIRNILDRLEI